LEKIDITKFEPLVSEFDKLPKRAKLEVRHVFEKMKTLERRFNDLLEKMGDLVIKKQPSRRKSIA
jgi:hypothetical protein